MLSNIRVYYNTAEVDRKKKVKVPEALPWFSRLEYGSGNVGFVVDKVALGQVFSEYFGFLCRLFHNHHLSSGAGTIGQTVASVPSRLSLTPNNKQQTPWP
jgi:hypothetical protein